MQTTSTIRRDNNKIMAACCIPALGQHVERHGSVCVQLHFNICEEKGAKSEKECWYEHAPNLAETRSTRSPFVTLLSRRSQSGR